MKGWKQARAVAVHGDRVAAAASRLLSLLMQQANMMPAAMLLFVVSAVVILAGLLGLFIQVKKEPAESTAAAG